MTLRECYNSFGGDLDKLTEMIPAEAIIKKLILKFPQDPSFARLDEAMANGDTQAAFTAAHALKGVSGNLQLGNIFRSVSELTELLRSGDMDGAKALFPAVKDDYNAVLDAISSL